ncbi:MAG: ribonuclease P protein component [Bacteroidota bacterium]|nr:ribonuclease P protein component [Bacteroidota bacterium]
MHTFRKEERLCGKKNIQGLFSRGKSFYLYPFKVYWIDGNADSSYPARVLISVSKRTIRLAVRRNLLKRRMREAYRRNKAFYYDYLTSRDKHFYLGIVYIGKESISYAEIEQKIIQILKRLLAECKN